MKLGLILIDIQNDYFKGGKHELVRPEQAAINAHEILNFFRVNQWPIYHVRHISLKSNAGFFIQNTPGTDFYKEVAPLGEEQIITKHKPDSFLGTDLKEKLDENGVDALVVCGMMTHMCIDTTVRSASAHGYDVTLIEDACTTSDLVWQGETVFAEQVHNVFMAALDGTFAKVQMSKEWLDENSKPL